MTQMMRNSTIALMTSLAVAWMSGPVLAQSVAFGGLQGNTDAPVEITADQLQVDQEAGEATFTGNVIVIQAEMRLTANELIVEYVADGGNEIDEIRANGSVTLVTPEEAAESDAAVYAPTTGDLVMTGNVLMTQGQTVMSGNRLTVDMNTGRGQMDGRVRTILNPGGN